MTIINLPDTRKTDKHLEETRSVPGAYASTGRGEVQTCPMPYFGGSESPVTQEVQKAHPVIDTERVFEFAAKAFYAVFALFEGGVR